jgi:hypothetical protein
MVFKAFELLLDITNHRGNIQLRGYGMQKSVNCEVQPTSNQECAIWN